MLFPNRRIFSLTVVISLFLSLLAVVTPSFAPKAEAAARTKFTICHRTNAITNPYRRITVAWSSVNEDGGGHDNVSHDGRVFDVNDPDGTHGIVPRDSTLGGGNDRWGDIFYAEKNAGQWNAKNWFVNDANKNSGNNVAGQAIYNGATFTINGVTKQACKTMTAKEFIVSETDALLEINNALPVNQRRTTQQVIGDVMAGLDEMGAAEDVVLKEQLGGSFSTWYASCTSNCDNVSSLTNSIDSLPQPSVTTTSPTITSSSAATLNGTITPLGQSMSWYFEFSTTNDFTDSNLAIVNHPATPSGPSTANGPVSVSTPVTGLTSGTTYYYRTVGLIPSGSGDAFVESFYYGEVKSFSTSNPSVTTVAATLITGTTASINGTGTTNGANSTVTFTWGTRSDLTGGDTQTGQVPSPSTLSEPATGAAFTLGLTNLTAGTTYYFQAHITNSNGSAQGAILSFTTLGPPSVTTSAATSVTGTTATINGTGSTNGANSTVTFTWGTTSDLSGNDTLTGQAATPGTLTDPTVNGTFSLSLTALTPGTRYYFRASISSANGSNNGAILEFTTPTPTNQNNVTAPAVTTVAASSVTGTSATLNGAGDTNGADSTVTFTWGKTSDLSGSDTLTGQAATPGTLTDPATGSAFVLNLTGLTPGTTYYFRASISNTNGSANGSILNFTTTASTASSAADPLGRVIGTAWFDIDRDNRRDADEPLLPGVDVRLTPLSVSGQSATRIRKTNYVMKTDSSGAFDFSDLPPGTYRITSILPAEFGIQESWDSTGNSDWQVTVTVVALQTSRGDFAAIGLAEASGSVNGGGGGTLDATWTGFDQKDGTNDDVTFTAKLSGDGNFSLASLPSGKYTVKATSKTGRTLVTSNTLRITSKDATLTLNGMTMKVKIVAFLPSTGATNMFLPFGFAALLVPAGAAVSYASRRRRRTS